MYVYPQLSNMDLLVCRLLGPGLGNLLFTWARAVVAAKRNGLKLIQATWPQVKFGPLIRRERDSRFYTGLFQPARDEVAGWEKLALLAGSRRVNEEDLEATLASPRARTIPSVVVFRGMNGYFEQFLQDFALVRQCLLEASRPCHRPAPRKARGAGIGLHVRLGDFIAVGSEAVASGVVGVRIPLNWYCRVITCLRKSARTTLPVRVYSDAPNDELRELLALPGVERNVARSALGDLWDLSMESILVTSGSTFSMWASYLGRAPVIWHQGQLRQRLYTDHPEFEIEAPPTGEVAPAFREAILRRIRQEL